MTTLELTDELQRHLSDGDAFSNLADAAHRRGLFDRAIQYNRRAVVAYTRAEQISERLSKLSEVVS